MSLEIGANGGGHEARPVADPDRLEFTVVDESIEGLFRDLQQRAALHDGE
jgi:hypothetical protein